MPDIHHRPGSEHISLSGLTEGEAKEFNSLFVTSFLIFTGVAIVAHILVWIWRPWGQGPVNPQQVSELLHPLLTMLS
ncbi:light-harvesting antenna LH1, beta subunit [Pararhizobium mangrovi]|uniref:Light-harvesting protein n=1 Tax=Pararhizobium mangrovi TaxID=2590452 RepID=A0A506UCX7_9HYPH|nr:light-harvesting antenna LH1, beta subunit [Pararhizobium mangrovi]TPW29597.1 light-harvesting protein [Pararhizobium mangrovi]